MIVEGIKLMVVGMTTVLLFLILMILLIQLIAHLTRHVTAREMQAISDERIARRHREKLQREQALAGDDADIVVIAAAVAAFEAEMAVKAG